MDLRLLVESSTGSPDEKSIQLSGKWWKLIESLPVEDPSQIPQFTCISYVWGAGRGPNPFYIGVEMSDRTLSALATAIQHCQTPAYWIDAFCIPLEQPQKGATLESMGFIYSLAAEVVVSLDSSTGMVLKKMSRYIKKKVDYKELDDDDLNALELDGWVESVWTYQEVVNSRQLRLVSRNWLAEWFGIWTGPWTEEATVDGETFINLLGASLMSRKERHAITDLDVYDGFPRLDAVMETLLDWQIADYLQRSAHQVISNMDRRSSDQSKDRFYSMLGSVTKDPSQRQPSITVPELAEAFMRICEEKNDYSFIYTVAPRDNTPGKSWRPDSTGQLSSLVSWHNWGEGQRGYHDEAGFWLDAMNCLYQSSHLDTTDVGYLADRAGEFGMNMTDANEEKTIRTISDILLNRLGYKGVTSPVITPKGLFYPYTPLAPKEGSTFIILVSTQIRWRFGAPGLAKVTTGEQLTFIPGVFVGDVFKMESTAAPHLVGPKIQ